MTIIGIDLGTTNSLVAVWTEDGPERIKNALGDYLTPSVVGLDDDGSILIGQPAKERLLTHPDLTIADFKRLMGSAKQIPLGKRSFRPEELSALLLRALKEDAENHCGEKITETVISVPAYFNDLQRKATIDAGKLAGLKVERLINEPTAAALAYGLNEVEEAQFLVFDLGGGTFDVSILDKYENIMEVRASAGDNYLGGNDFNVVIRTLICEQSKIDWKSLSPAEKNRITRLSEQLKIKLSQEQEADYQINLSAGNYKGVISRDQFMSAADGLMRRLRKPIERAISDATLQPSEIEKIIMVGGATRMPEVRRLIARLFSKLPLSNIDPDHLVALGAAVQAGLKARHHALEDVVMTDVCPYTLGIAILDDMSGSEEKLLMSPMIERNAVVPISRTDRFFTTADNQTRVNVEIYQGENLRPNNNIHLGSLDIKVPRAKAHEQSIMVRFTYDINGALEVEVWSEETGKKETRLFKNQANLSDKELEERFKKLEDIKLHPRDRTENRTLLARAERIWAESIGGKREFITQIIRQFEMDINDQRNQNMEKSQQEFSEVLDNLENTMFDIDE